MTRVVASALRPVIYLTAGGREKGEATDEVLLAVADYVQRHFGGRMEAAYRAKGDGSRLTIQITVTENAPQSADESPEGKEVPETGVRRSESRTRTEKGHVSPDAAQQIHDHENGATR